MCACVCGLRQGVLCSRGGERPPGLWARRGARYPLGARPRMQTHARTQPLDSTAAGRELQPQRTHPWRPRGRGEGGFLPASVLWYAVVWAGRGRVESGEVCTYFSLTCTPVSPPTHPSPPHTHARTQPQALIQRLACSCRPCLTCPEDPTHWRR